MLDGEKHLSRDWPNARHREGFLESWIVVQSLYTCPFLVSATGVMDNEMDTLEQTFLEDKP